ncbi:transmembrane protein 223-like [Antedon mediterranea]|uniref:transmembrane protein 223-like n=1 Tax=Antedon mediterranea TaxID=105859 RepID=UPI003AF5E65E
MQLFQKICTQKLLQTLPTFQLHSCKLITKVTPQYSRWTFAYYQACKTRSAVPIMNRVLLFRNCSTSSSTVLGAEITKPVLLYRGNQKRLFQFVSLFAVSQLVFWGYLTHVAFTSMKDSYIKQQIKYGPDGTPKELRKWTTWEGIKLNMSASRWRYGITALSMAAGGTIFVLSFLYSRKNISALVLRQGGQHLTFETYGIFAQGYTFTVPITEVSCNYTRHAGKSTLPIKVKNHKLFYSLDATDGNFYYGRLFDNVVTVTRYF